MAAESSQRLRHECQRLVKVDMRCEQQQRGLTATIFYRERLLEDILFFRSSHEEGRSAAKQDGLSFDCASINQKKASMPELRNKEEIERDG